MLSIVKIIAEFREPLTEVTLTGYEYPTLANAPNRELASRGESNGGGGGGGFVVLVVERTREAFTRHRTVVPLSKPF